MLFVVILTVVLGNKDKLVADFRSLSKSSVSRCAGHLCPPNICIQLLSILERDSGSTVWDINWA